MTKCREPRYGAQQAESAVKRQPGAFAYRCSQCDGTHVSTGDHEGRTLLMENRGGRVIAFIDAEIVQRGGIDI